MVVNYSLFSWSQLNKEELKVYQNHLESYNHFTLGWVKEVKIKLLLNYLLKLPWLLDGSVGIMYFLFHSNVRYRCTVFISLGEIPEREGVSPHPAFMGNFPIVSLKC